MERTAVVVSCAAPDIVATGIADAVRGRAELKLLGERVVDVGEVGPLLATLPQPARCAVILVAPRSFPDDVAAGWLARSAERVVVVRVDTDDELVTARVLKVNQVDLRDPALASLLDLLQSLLEQSGAAPENCVVQLRPRGVFERGAAAWPQPQRPLLAAALAWVHAVVRAAVGRQSRGGDLPGLTVTAATVVESLEAHAALVPAEASPSVNRADADLTQALARADPQSEPLAALANWLQLTPLEFRLLLLALAPDLDLRYQRCMGLMLDDLGRRSGTLALLAALLGEPAEVRRRLAATGNLVRWRLLSAADGTGAGLNAADQPLRVDPQLIGWLLGDAAALEHDPLLRRCLRGTPWPGTELLPQQRNQLRASRLLAQLRPELGAGFLIFAGAPANLRALVELGASMRNLAPLRVEAARLETLDGAAIEECGLRLGRLARLTNRPLLLDVTATGVSAQDDEALRALLAALASTQGRAGVIGAQPQRLVRLLGAVPFSLLDADADAITRSDLVRAAAVSLGVALDAGAAGAVAERFPMQADGFELALRLARVRARPQDGAERRFESFLGGCREVASEKVSRLAERIEPIFELNDVVLPPDRSQQLQEVVDSVRLSAAVLDDWKFGEKLPYGRGVSALFCGSSGTGKTMAAQAVAKALDLQLLRLDLSRVVSKYIGDTEKNIDIVFEDAAKSGAALLVDEADALFGKRSEVKDAHDRYANIEVAFLLQRMEAFEGLAILTTNLRQNLDPAFLRRLRFIVDFPRPDAEARERIWRFCLPPASHQLDDAAFRQLARKIDLTGGHIRQITLRAAFAAAAVRSRIGLEHIARAARAELAKLGLPAVALDAPEQRRAA